MILVVIVLYIYIGTYFVLKYFFYTSLKTGKKFLILSDYIGFNLAYVLSEFIMKMSDFIFDP